MEFNAGATITLGVSTHVSRHSLDIPWGAGDLRNTRETQTRDATNAERNTLERKGVRNEGERDAN